MSKQTDHIGDINEMVLNNIKVSDCCQAPMTDPLMEDYGICPECKDHCEFIEEEED